MDAATIKARAQGLRTLGKRKLQEFLAAQLGHEVDVLVEKETRGHTQHFAPVTLTKPAHNGTVIKGRVTRMDGESLIVDQQSACRHTDC